MYRRGTEVQQLRVARNTTCIRGIGFYTPVVAIE